MLQLQGVPFFNLRSSSAFFCYLLGFHLRFDLSKGFMTLGSLKITRLREYIYIYICDLVDETRQYTLLQGRKLRRMLAEPWMIFTGFDLRSTQKLRFTYLEGGEGEWSCTKSQISPTTRGQPPHYPFLHTSAVWLVLILAWGIMGRKRCYSQPQVWIDLLTLLPLHPLFYKTS